MMAMKEKEIFKNILSLLYEETLLTFIEAFLAKSTWNVSRDFGKTINEDH